MILVDRNRCVGCGVCISLCPDAIRLEIEKGFAWIVENEKRCVQKAMRACPQKAIEEINGKVVIAIGTDDNTTLKSDEHVGMSRYFHIFEYSEEEIVFKEKRENPKFQEDETRIHGDPEKAKATASVLNDVDVLVGKLIGPNIVRLKKKFVCAIVREKMIADVAEVIKENICMVIHEKNRKDKSEGSGIVLKKG